MPCPISNTKPTFIYTHLACGILSSLSCSFILFYCLHTNRLQIFSFKLIFYISLSQLFTSLEFLFPLTIQNTNSSVCSLFGLLINSSQLNSVLWMTCVAFSIRQAFMGSMVFFDKSEKYWAIVALILIPLLNCIPILTGSYEAVGSSCTYDTGTDGTFERIFIFFVPAWVMLVYSIGCYVQIFVKMRQIEVGLTFKRIIQKLIWYPVLMAFNLVLLTVERIALYYMEECDLQVMDYVVKIVVSLNGFFNLIVFLATPGTIAALRRSQARSLYESTSEFSSTMQISLEDSRKAPKGR